MQVYLVTAEHYSVPGIIVRVAATKERAIWEALLAANIMLRDAGMARVSDESSMNAALERLQDEKGAAHCYVEISMHEVLQ